MAARTGARFAGQIIAVPVPVPGSVAVARHGRTQRLAGSARAVDPTSGRRLDAGGFVGRPARRATDPVGGVRGGGFAASGAAGGVGAVVATRAGGASARPGACVRGLRACGAGPGRRRRPVRAATRSALRRLLGERSGEEPATEPQQQNDDERPRHQREQLRDRQQDVDDEVLESAFCSGLHQIERDHCDTERDQRWLGDGGEQRPAAHEQHSCHTADEVEDAEGGREFALSGPVDDRTDHGGHQSDENGAPPGHTAHSREYRLLFRGDPGTRLLGREHV